MGRHFVRPRSALQLRRSLPHGSRPEDGLLLVIIIIQQLNDQSNTQRRVIHRVHKNKNIFEKMGGYVGFLPPPTYFLHIRCDQHVVSQVAYFGSMWVGVRILHIHPFFRKCFYSCLCYFCVKLLHVHCAALGLVYTHNTHFCMCPTVPNTQQQLEPWTNCQPLANSQS